jgi:hypothetical protein
VTEAGSLDTRIARKHFFLLSGLSLYVLLIILTIGLTIVQRTVGISGFLGDLMFWSAVVWPYSFLLSVQRYVHDPSGALSFIGAYTLGFCLVTGWGVFLDRLGLSSRLGAWARPLATVSWYLPLLTIQLASLGIAVMMGWPIGE